MSDIATAAGGPAYESSRVHEIRRVRHEVRPRTVTVVGTELLNPGMLRVRFQSAELADFPSAGPDDHVKLVLPTPGGEAKRDYTPRAFDRAAGTLVVDFALHGAGGGVGSGAGSGADGPATRWARSARPGDTLVIRGPRGSLLVPGTFDWLLLVGDATALPAIGRRVEELGAGTSVATVVVVDDLAEAQAFRTAARWDAEWVVRDGPDDVGPVCRAIDRVFPQVGDGYVWIAGEASWMQGVRDHVAARHGHPKEWMKASGYWVRGAAQGD